MNGKVDLTFMFSMPVSVPNDNTNEDSTDVVKKDELDKISY